MIKYDWISLDVIAVQIKHQSRTHHPEKLKNKHAFLFISHPPKKPKTTFLTLSTVPFPLPSFLNPLFHTFIPSIPETVNAFYQYVWLKQTIQESVTTFINGIF